MHLSQLLEPLSGTITTISDGGCPEVVQDIVITVNPAPVTNTGGTDTSGNSANGSTTSEPRLRKWSIGDFFSNQ